MTTDLVQIIIFFISNFVQFFGLILSSRISVKKKSQHERIEWVNLSTCAETEKSTSERK